jgi:tetratricopeptide (TPR) repeat protein
MSPYSNPNRLTIWYLQALLLAIAVVLSYGHTLDVPFYLDDFSSIQENPVIYQWQGTLAELWQFAALRIVGYLSFALNYQVHQFQVAGYHVVNIFIHFLTGCAVLGLLRGLVRTPLLTHTLSDDAKRWLPLVVALIFVLHPLQIQAVTYIVQRLASLAALFYIGTMACFIQARLSQVTWQRALWIITCILLALLAFFTKQNTATLPIALLLLELTFFPLHQVSLPLLNLERFDNFSKVVKSSKFAERFDNFSKVVKSSKFAERVAKVAIALFGLIVFGGLVALVLDQNPFSLQAMQALTQETTEISRTSYLATQMSVLWTYLGLFVWPATSHIDYDYPITEGFLDSNDNYHLIARLLHSEALWALAGHLILLGLAFYSFRRKPLIAFSIIFYYLAHSIESGLIPIRDVIFEHRTYLPNLGLCILSGWLLVVTLSKFENLDSNRFSLSIIHYSLFIGILLSYATWQRNQMWRDPIALWQHNVAQSPGKQRGWIILGKHLLQADRPAEGLKVLEEHAVVKSYRADGNYDISLTTETALNIVVAHKMLRQYDEALKWIDIAFQNPTLRPFDQAKFLVNKGNILFEQRRYPEAEASYRQAMQVYPQNLKARINLASVLGMSGRIDEAIALYQEVLAIDPSDALVKEQLQKLLLFKK